MRKHKKLKKRVTAVLLLVLTFQSLGFRNVSAEENVQSQELLKESSNLESHVEENGEVLNYLDLESNTIYAEESQDYLNDADIPLEIENLDIQSKVQNKVPEFPGSGSGTLLDPFLITNVEQLKAVNNSTLAYYKNPIVYKLANSLDLRNEEWTPIGTWSYSFTGVFDGNGYTISNLKINSKRIGYSGLFGYAYRATLRNINIKNIDISGEDRVGGLTGFIDAGLIENCSVSGVSNAEGSVIGGLIGEVWNSTIKECYATVNVTGSTSGGLIGQVAGSTVQECYATGSVSGTYYTGGLVGNAGNTNIKDCFALGDVHGSYSSGLVGITDLFSGGEILTTIKNCYSAGKLSSERLFGLTQKPCINSYFNSSVNSNFKDKINGRTAEELKLRQTFVGWDFSTIWKIEENANYPYLMKLPNPHAGQEVSGEITLSKALLTLNVKDSDTLVASHPGILGTVSWVSDNSSVATVDRFGKVTAKSAGVATIKATICGKTAICIVTVTGDLPVSVQSISLSDSSLSITPNDSHLLLVRFSPVNAINKRISWTTSDASVAIVSANGKVTGISPGTANIIAKSEDGNKTAKCIVTVLEEDYELLLPDYISFDASIPGPTLTFIDKKFTLFDLPIGFELSLPGDNIPGTLRNKVKLVYDPDEKKYIAYFGDFEGVDSDKDIQFRQQTYRNIRTLMGMMGKKTNREFYNKWRSLTKKSGPLSVNGNKTYFGYVSVIKNNNKWVLSEGEFGILFEAGLTFKSPTPVPAVFMKYEVTGDAQSGLKLVLKEAGNIFGGTLPYGNLESSLGLSAAVGFDSFVANTYGGVEGKLNGKVDFPFRSQFVAERDLEVQAELSIFLEYEALMLWGDKRSWKFAEWPLYPDSSKFQKNIARIATEELKLLSRDYLAEPSAFSANHLARNFSVNSNMDTVIKTNIFPNSQTKLLDIGENRKILIWIDDAGSTRTSANRTALYYSIYDGSSRWSSPKMIDDDGTADFSFDSCLIDGDIYIVWQNAEELFDDNISITEAATKIGISITKLPKDLDSFSSPQKLTKASDGLNAMPSISGTSNSHIIATWVNNTASDITGESGTNILKTSKFNGNTWGIATDIMSTSTDVIESIATAFEGDLHRIVYSAHPITDSYMDSGIYTISTNEQPIKITENGVKAYNPRFVNNNGSLDLYWNTEDAVLYTNKADGTDAVTILEGVGVVRDFEILTNGDNKVLYWESSDGFRISIQALFWDSTLSKWSDSVELVKGYDGRLRASSGFVQSDGTLHFTYLAAPFNELISGDDSPYGNSDLLYSLISPAYDISVEEVYYDTSEVEAGGRLPINVHVRNNGQLTIQKVQSQLQDSSVGIVQNKIIEQQLLPGEEYEFIAYYDLPQALTKRSLVVNAMPYGDYTTLPDIDMSNNESTITIGLARLSIGQPVVSGCGSTRNVKVDIQNTGYDNTQNPIVIDLFVHGSNEQIDSINIGILPPQSAVSADFTVDITQFDFNEESDDILICAAVNQVTEDIEGPSATISKIQNPYKHDTLSISPMELTDSNLRFTITNNFPKNIMGTVLFQHENNTNENLLTYGQSLSLDAWAERSLEMDLSVFGETEHLKIKISVVDDNDNVISNVCIFTVNGDDITYPIAIEASESDNNNITVGKSVNR